MSEDDSEARLDGARRFATTHWSVVLAACSDEDTRSCEALTRLCRTYWYPLYAFVRRHGYGPEDAEDLTQGFFAHLLKNDALSKVDRSLGKFRSFLLASLRHFLSNQRAHDSAKKRGGGCVVIPLDLVGAETRYGLEAAEVQTPDKAFEQNWALALLERVLERLRIEQQQAGKATQFERLGPCLMGDAPGYDDLAAQLGMSKDAVKMAVSRLRRRYGQLLREEIAHTVNAPAEVEEELRHLLAVLGG